MSAFKKRVAITVAVSVPLMVGYALASRDVRLVVGAFASGWMVGRIGIFLAEALVPDAELFSERSEDKNNTNRALLHRQEGAK